MNNETSSEIKEKIFIESLENYNDVINFYEKKCESLKTKIDFLTTIEISYFEKNKTLQNNFENIKKIFKEKYNKLKDRFLVLGKDYSAPKWNFDYYDELAKSKTALNLSRGLPVKYTSSNRISSLIANGIYTFIDEKTKFYDFFNEDEVGFYKNENDLLNKLDKILSNEKNLKKFSENGKRKYFELFDSKIIAKNIISDFS